MKDFADTKMNILMVSHDSGLSGAPRSMVNLAKELKKYNINIYIVLPSHGAIERELRKNQLKYYIFPYKNCYRKMGEINYKAEFKQEIFNLKAVCKMVALIKEKKIDIVHSNTIATDMGAMAALVSRKPHIWHIREFMEEDHGYEHYCKWKISFLIKRMFAGIAISQAVKEKYIKLYHNQNIKLIYNGVPIDDYIQDKKALLQNEQLSILISGTLIEGKGQEEAIEAIVILLKKGYHNINLYLAGEGDKEYISKLKRIVKSNNCEDSIHFMGQLSREKLNQVRLSSDIELVCSRNEAFGRVTVEAMMSDLLVIGADTGGTKELIRNGENGILYKQGNATDLALKVEKVLCNKKMARKWIKVAKEEAIKLYDIKVTAKNVYNLYLAAMKIK